MEESPINPYQSPQASLSDFESNAGSQEGYRPAYKLYSIWSIVLATLLGSPLAGGIVMSINYKRLGFSRKAMHAIIWSVAGTFGIMAIAFFLPDNVPDMAIAVPQLLAMIAIATTLQGKAIETQKARGGAFSSAWIAAGIGFLCLIALLLVIGLIVFALAAITGESL
jgi:hypothetical protein